MAKRIETITQHIFAFDDYEITMILNALYEAGYDELSDEIFEELDGECECEGCGQGDNGTVEDLIDAINKFTEGR